MQIYVLRYAFSYCFEFLSEAYRIAFLLHLIKKWENLLPNVSNLLSPTCCHLKRLTQSF